MNLLKKLFGKKEEKQEVWIPKRVIEIWKHNGWGNSISWDDWQKRRLVGWLSPKPDIDDEIRGKLDSGKTGRFRVINVEHQQGVHDMFFCTVSDIGYLEDTCEAE